MPSDPITGPDPSTLTTTLLAERLASERALREQAMAYIERALLLQAEEYERRLEGLNHAHEQAVAAQAATVPREMFEAYVKEQEAKQNLATDVAEKARQALANEVTIERNARIRLEGALGTWRFIAGFLGLSGVVGVLLGLIALFGPGQ